MADQNTIDRAMSGLGSTMVRAGQVLKRARQDFGHAHEPRQKLVTTLLACLSALVAISLLMVNWSEAAPLDYVELPTRDLRVRWLESNDHRDRDILLINIDEAALSYGDYLGETDQGINQRYAWPWPRHVYNKIIRYCRDGGARVIVFDMVFSESGPNTNEVLIQREIAGKLTRVWTFDKASDDMFALEATARDDVALALVLGTTEQTPDVRGELLPAYAGELEGAGETDLLLQLGDRCARFRSADAPFPALLDGWPSIAESGRRGDEKAGKLLDGLRNKVNSDPLMNESSRYRSLLPLTPADSRQGVAGLGTVMGFEDIDGVLRRYDVVESYGTQLYRTLPLETWRLYVLSHARDALADPARLETFKERCPNLELADGKLLWDSRSYSLDGELRDVPVRIEDRRALYLGRSMPLDPTGRVELRFRNFLAPEQNADWTWLTAEQQASVRERHPDGRLFATYPQLSARDILRDWDVLSENRRRDTEIQRLRAEMEKLEADLASAPEADKAGISERLTQARESLTKLQAEPPQKLALGSPAEVLKDKIVIVAGTATGLLDRHDTPLDSNTPGTWVLATFIDNLKNNDFMRSTPAWLNWCITLLLTVLAVLGVKLAGRMRNGLVLTALLGVLVLVACWALFTQQVWFPVAAPLAGLALGFSNGALAKALTEGHQRRQRESFARQYMGKELVDHVIRNPGSLKLGGENRPMTMYFSDVAGFTTVTETLGPNNPERLVELLNIYLERMTDLMLSTGGVIDKYIGDAIMCFWGAPMAQEDHAARACRGALLCRSELQRMQPLFADAVRGVAPQLIKPDGSVLYARAGINSGIVTVGNMGSSKRFAYTVMGDAVNLAARLEPQCKEYGTDILIGEKTEELIRGEFTLRRIDLMVVKGKTQPVQVFELIGEKDPPQFVRDLLQHFERGIDLFRDRQFEAALESFKHAAHHETAQDEDEINPSRLYIERCESYLRNPPPPEWNGVVVKTSK
ncbi:MAG: adenylate/guanylate cyclase domain-containing protein [Planctomycetes bacterium]|nr:adenylate/guanylate cyclase domain-containing protein [Planctomycetota bacterium]MCB9935687.1 adenylate/guanylate cyclase domain-containing protein [Planctomycetota bacterium]